jgi:hypothetical protein
MPDAQTYLDPANWHPAANIFPLVEGEELAALVADTWAYGLRHPIVLHEGGLLLDGRNRLRACAEAGVTPRWTTSKPVDGMGPVARVSSQSRHRRHSSSVHPTTPKHMTPASTRRNGWATRWISPTHVRMMRRP